MEEAGNEKFLSRRRSAALKSFKVKDERVATFKKVRAKILIRSVQSLLNDSKL